MKNDLMLFSNPRKLFLTLILMVVVLFLGYQYFIHTTWTVEAQTLGDGKRCVKRTVTTSLGNPLPGYATEEECKGALKALDPTETVACTGANQVCVKGIAPPDAIYSYTKVGMCNLTEGTSAGLSDDSTCWYKSPLQKTCDGGDGKTYFSGACMPNATKCANGLRLSAPECNTINGACIAPSGEIVANNTCSSTGYSVRCVNGNLQSDASCPNSDEGVFCRVPGGSKIAANTCDYLTGKLCLSNGSFQDNPNCVKAVQASCNGTASGSCIDNQHICVNGESRLDSRCSTDLNTDSQNCGKIGNACAANQVCTNGTCTGGIGGGTDDDTDDDTDGSDDDVTIGNICPDNGLPVKKYYKFVCPEGCPINEEGGVVAPRCYENMVESTEPLHLNPGECGQVDAVTGDGLEYCGYTEYTCGEPRCQTQDPLPSPTPSPSAPAGPQCLSITISDPSPVVGDQVTFTCGEVAGAHHYIFRIVNPAGGITNLSATGRVSAPLNVTTANTYRAQCQVCTGADASTCNAFEPL